MTDIRVKVQNRLRQYMDGGPLSSPGEENGDNQTSRGISSSLGGHPYHSQGDEGGSRVKEGRMVNVDVTAPGTIANRMRMFLHRPFCIAQEQL